MTEQALSVSTGARSCSDGGTPCESTTSAAAAPRKLAIELLYLDVTTCGRCKGTEENLEAAIADAAGVLALAGVEVSLRKVHVDTAALARRHRFVSSPTIRVDGRDVAFDLRESACADCTRIAGSGGGVDCRVWVWQGEEHPAAPKPLIVDAILRAAYAPPTAPARSPEPYALPENLRRFYAATAPDPGGTCCADVSTCCADDTAPQDAGHSCCPDPAACCASATIDRSGR